MATPAGAFVACALLALALRAPFLAGDLESDEAGLLLVVRSWDPGPGRLYGGYWVDRPPLLLGWFALADLLPGTSGVRALAAATAVGQVAAAVWAGHRLAGSAGAWSAGLVTGALGSAYVLGGHLANGMVQGTTLVLASCAVVVHATTGGDRATARRGLLVVAGALGAGAVLVKQNLVGGLVLACVVVAARGLAGATSRRRALGDVGAVVGGAGLVLLGLLAWLAVADVRPEDLWYAVVEFRWDAAREVAQVPSDAPLERRTAVGWAAVVTGLVGVVALFLAAARGLLRDDPAVRPYVAGLLALLAVALVGIMGGRSWWSHYLLQLVPAAALGTALVARRRPSWWRPTAVVVAWVVLAGLVGAGTGAVREQGPSRQAALGHDLAAVAEPGDTVVVAYGTAEVVLHSGLSSDHEHLWSLPLRVLDPGAEELRSHLAGDGAPTWLVQAGPFDVWDLDPHGHLAATVEERYRVVASPCGFRVHLLEGVVRPGAEEPGSWSPPCD